MLKLDSEEVEVMKTTNRNYKADRNFVLPPQHCTLLESVTSSDMRFRALLFSKTSTMHLQITKTNRTQIQITKTNRTQIYIHNDTDRTTRC